MSFIAKKLQEMDKRDNLDWRIIRRKVEGKLTVEEERQLREWIGRDLRRAGIYKVGGEILCRRGFAGGPAGTGGQCLATISCFCASCREIFLS